MRKETRIRLISIALVMLVLGVAMAIWVAIRPDTVRLALLSTQCSEMFNGAPYSAHSVSTVEIRYHGPEPALYSITSNRELDVPLSERKGWLMPAPSPEAPFIVTFSVANRGNVEGRKVWVEVVHVVEGNTERHEEVIPAIHYNKCP